MKYFRILFAAVKILNLLLGNRDKDKRKLCEGSDKDDIYSHF